MAGNLSAYTLLFVTVSSQMLAEEQNVTIDRTTNAQPVNTVPNGYSGDSPGAGMCEFVVTGAVPATGLEFDAGAAMAGMIPTQVYALGPGGKQLKGECMIFADSIRHGVNQPAEYTFRARSKFTLWS